MSRLIDADKLYIKFCGFEDSISESDMDKISATISSMPTAYDPEKIIDQLEYYLFEKYCVEGDTKIEEIVKGGGVDV